MRGRSERAFRTHQERLPKELANAGITDMGRANAYLQRYRRTHNSEFSVRRDEAGSAFVAFIGVSLNDICASTSSAPWAMITACSSRACACRFPPITIACIV